MSTAHRPTWNPTEGRADVRHMTRRVAAQELPAHTKLKFRQPQQGGGPSTVGSNSAGRSEQHRRDLKRELEAAERANRNKKRREQGLAPEEEPADEHDDDKATMRQAIEGAPADGRGGGEQGDLDDEEVQRRKMIAQLQELDRDESDSDSDAGAKSSKAKGKGKANGDAEGATVDDDNSDSSSSSSSSSDDSDDDDEDETAALLRELEKIKRERAEEKERQERERAEMQQASREEEIALGNPLLNLENALKRGGSGGASARGGGSGAGMSDGFGVKRRWDDDVIFKNQAAGNEGADKSGFINDLTRSEFHKRFMQRYVK